MATPEFLKITQADLKQSATKYKRELLILPLQKAESVLSHMRAMPGVAGKVGLGELDGEGELGPYDASRVDETGVAITARELETHLGSLIKRFDVNAVAKTAWGEIYSQGEKLTKADIALAVARLLAGKISEKLAKAIWNGVRNSAGTKTKDIFDGFDTLTQKAIDANEIATDEGNLYEFSGAITTVNAWDELHKFYQAASAELQDVKTKLYVSHDIYNAYQEAALTRLGAVPYNEEYKKRALVCSDGLCELVPMVGKKGSSFIQLSTKNNLVYGFGDGLADEKIDIVQMHEILLSFVATMFFGVQYESVKAQRLFVGKLA